MTLAAGSYLGGMGRIAPRPARYAGRTGANVRGVVLDDLLGANTVDVPSIRLGRLGDGVNVCTDAGWSSGLTIGSSLLSAIGSAITASAGTSGTEGYDAGRATAGRTTTASADAFATAYAASCVPAPGTAATSPAVGSPTNAEITAMLSAARTELAATREAATSAEIERARAEAAQTQRTQQYLMIGGGVALLALVAVVALRK